MPVCVYLYPPPSHPIHLLQGFRKSTSHRILQEYQFPVWLRIVHSSFSCSRDPELATSKSDALGRKMLPEAGILLQRASMQRGRWVGPTSFGALDVAALRPRRREQVYGNEPPPPPPPLCRARPPAREARERGSGPGTAATGSCRGGDAGRERVAQGGHWQPGLGRSVRLRRRRWAISRGRRGPSGARDPGTRQSQRSSRPAGAGRERAGAQVEAQWEPAVVAVTRERARLREWWEPGASWADRERGPAEPSGGRPSGTYRWPPGTGAPARA